MKDIRNETTFAKQLRKTLLGFASCQKVVYNSKLYPNPMTVRKKTVLTLVSVFAVVTIFRETNTISLSWYNTNSTYNSNSSWNKNTYALPDSSSQGLTDFNNLISELPIIVLYRNDTLYSESADQLSVIINISSLNYGFLWTPLYKSSRFKARGTTSFHYCSTNTNRAKTKLVQTSFSGSLEVTGNITITGFFSQYQAVNLIKEQVIESFVEETRKYISNLD